MSWLKLEIETSSNAIDIICGILVDFGITGVEVKDKADFLEFINDNNKQWDFVDDELMALANQMKSVIVCYIPNNDDGNMLVEKIKNTIDEVTETFDKDFFGDVNIIVQDIGEDNWTESWKKYYKPIEIGENLLVNPIWKQVPDTNRKVLKMNPGNMFGTGAHQSTQLCLEFIEKHIKDGDNIFDVGCGSGILAIGGLILGASKATAVDIDTNVSRAVSENLEYNDISKDKVKIYSGNILEDDCLKDKCKTEKYDFVFANIVADVIIALLKDIHLYLKDNGRFVCSGVIIDRKDDVLFALKDSGLEVIEINQKDDWVSIMCIYKSNKEI